jgi:hypothetical protein
MTNRGFLLMIRSLLACIMVMGTVVAEISAVPENVLSDWAKQYADLQRQIAEKKGLAKTGAVSAFPESQAFDRQALIWPEDSSPLDVGIRRTQALINHLKTLEGATDMSGLEQQLEDLKVRN